MLNFSKTIEEVINEQAVHTRAKNFIEYNSKKKLLESDVLSDEQGEFIRQLKNTFAFSLHTGGRYLVVTMYYSTTKKYGFIVVDLEQKMTAECASIKEAKQAVLEIVANK